MPVTKTSPNGTDFRDPTRTREKASFGQEEERTNPHIKDELRTSRKLVENVLSKVHAMHAEHAISKEREAELRRHLAKTDDLDVQGLAEIERELEKSKAIADERKDLIKNKGADALEDSDAVSKREWNEFRKGKEFLNLSVSRREQLVNIVRGALPNAFRKQEAQREAIRQKCRTQLLRCARSARSAINEKDAEDYIREGMAEEHLAFAKTPQKKLEALREWEEKFIPNFIQKAEAAGQKVQELLRDARKEKAISLENMNEWLDRMKQGSWQSTEKFIHDKLPKYVAAWKEIAAKRRTLLQDPRMKRLKNSNLIKPAELNAFLSGKDFLNMHYKSRVNLVSLVHAAMRGITAGPDVEELLVEARAQLERAADEGVLAHDKVGVWLKRISKFKNDPKVIEDFLTGKGSDPLSKLKANWAKVRGRFDSIGAKIAKEGPIPSFHFVQLEVFLHWEYDKRETYIEQAEQRFEAYKKDPDVFLKIRHAFDTKDWNEAKHFLEDAEAHPERLMASQVKTLESLRRYYDAHASEAEGEEGMDALSGAEGTLESMRSALNQIPSASVRDRFIRALTEYDYQTLWALCTMYYNWKWCRIHGYSSDELDVNYEEGAKMNSIVAKETGKYSRGHTVLDSTGNTSVTMRTDNDTESAQGVFLDETTDNSELMRHINLVKNSRSVWYWTRFMEKNMPFGVMQNLIDNVFPVLKKGRRDLDKLGINFTESGPPQRKVGKVVPEFSMN